ISRSGATIVGGLILGLSRQVAAEFSFLVAVPVMAAATCFDLLKSWESLGSDALGELAVGFLVSFVVALFAIRTFVGFLQRFSLAGFGYYRVILGIISLVWFLGIVAGGS
ncbi:MAG: UDP-diphosphatase, partial [Bdellovibrionales bacterium]|nr:UDP-diphosphatase [Bdellovibrionales bacterium]